MDGGSALPFGTAQPALPLAEALGRCNPDQRAPSPALAKEDFLYATRPKPPAQLIRATRSRFGSPLVLSQVHWVRPEIILEVTYAEWTPDGLLRHVVYLGERQDKLAIEVHRSPPLVGEI
jgi:ATP dependent DNA ligase C terminal region